MSGPDVEQIVHELKGRKVALELEIAQIDTTLRHLAGFLKTPSREEHRETRRKHEPLPIRQRRMDAGIKLREFAQALGVSHSYLSQIESGSRKASDRTLANMEAGLTALIERRQSDNGGGRAA